MGKKLIIFKNGKRSGKIEWNSAGWAGSFIDRHQDSSAFDEFRQPLNRDLPSFSISPVTLLLGLYT